jgi:hypothetical protein
VKNIARSSGELAAYPLVMTKSWKILLVATLFLQTEEAGPLSCWLGNCFLMFVTIYAVQHPTKVKSSNQPTLKYQLIRAVQGIWS